jgi:SLT domain-containing protein
MIAAFRYAISRYGSMNSIPGVVAVRQGGSYVGY